jgi:hypothetical protein
MTRYVVVIVGDYEIYRSRKEIHTDPTCWTPPSAEIGKINYL